MGLAAYPWLADSRKEQKRDRPMEPMHLDCTHCREHNSEATRAAMGCGWMALEYDQDDDGKPLHPRDVWKPPQDTNEPPMICAGYTTMLPEVIDISTSYVHYERQALPMLFPDGVCRALLDGYGALDTSIKVFINKPVKQ